MNTRYVLTLCTALVVGGALLTGSALALGKADEKTRRHARSATCRALVVDGADQDCTVCRCSGQRE